MILLPYPSPFESAAALTTEDLRTQRHFCKRLFESISKKWTMSHASPNVIWREHPEAVLVVGLYFSAEYRRRTGTVGTFPFFQNQLIRRRRARPPFKRMTEFPVWVGDPAYHSFVRQLLLWNHWEEYWDKFPSEEEPMSCPEEPWLFT